MYKVIAEWDVGQENLLFDTRDEAVMWINLNEHFTEVARDNEATISDLMNDGLITIVALTRVGPAADARRVARSKK